MGLCGNLARSANMPYKDKEGNIDLKGMYMETIKEKLVVKPKVVQEHFLTPKPVLFEDKNNNRSIIAVACGAFHMLVIARDNNDPKQQGKLFSCGLNNYGQLGHGDQYNDRHALKLVRTNNIFYIRHV
jgi:hypothetical protein